MVVKTSSSRLEIGLGDEALELRIEVDDEGVTRLTDLAARPDRLVTGVGTGDDRTRPEGGRRSGLKLPLVDVVTSGSGRAWSGRRYVESVTGGRLRYLSHQQRADGSWRELVVSLADPVTGLVAEVTYRTLEGNGVLRSQVRLTNAGQSTVTVESVTSFLGSGLAGPGGELGDVDLLWAENDWLAESRWQVRGLRDALPDLNRSGTVADSRGRFGLTSVGSWSSGTYLPMGGALNRRTGNAWVWQIEHNGGWHWQVGEHSGRDADTSLQDWKGPTAAYLALLGPTDSEHHWRMPLSPGESFETVPVAVAVSSHGFEDAVARLTEYRRAVRRPHDDHRRLPVIFNDYMNTLNGDPTTERLVPLISGAARAGAEYFCIDAGWYGELGEPWWDTVGLWEPSTSRFPNGITEVLDLIRAENMVPGLWLEPEVVGINSPVAERLPDAAFFSRNGQRVVEQGRFHLDFSHPSARAHLDRVIDFLVVDLGVGYFKMDYNINVGPGTDVGGVSAGVGMLAHERAYLAWVDAILDRHPGLTIENCSSGGMRTDFALLSRFQLQSTSDQQDFLRYPPIAAASPVAMAPEQGAVWAYPQPEWSDDEIAFTLCSALLGRVHLSGHLDKMSDAQQLLVAEAISAYKRIRSELAVAVPFWPLGLPGWTDNWLALGMRGRSATHLVVWHRMLTSDSPVIDDAAVPAEIVLSLTHLRDAPLIPEVLYPAPEREATQWDPAHGTLTVTLPRTPSACLIRLGHELWPE